MNYLLMYSAHGLVQLEPASLSTHYHSWFLSFPSDGKWLHVQLQHGAAVLHVGSHQTRVESEDQLPLPTAHTSFDAAREKLVFWVPSACWWLMSVFSSTTTSKSLPAGPHSIPSSPDLCWFWRLQDPTFGLVEPHEAYLWSLSRSL